MFTCMAGADLRTGSVISPFRPVGLTDTDAARTTTRAAPLARALVAGGRS